MNVKPIECINFMSFWYDDQDLILYFVWKDAEWDVTVVEELELDGKP